MNRTFKDIDPSSWQESFPYNANMQLHEKLIADLNNELEAIIIEGLKRKGFQFENKSELEAFIVSNCRCEDDPVLQQRAYFVYDQPFFLHFYESEMCVHPIVEGNTFKVSASFGSYAYI